MDFYPRFLSLNFDKNDIDPWKQIGINIVILSGITESLPNVPYSQGVSEFLS